MAKRGETRPWRMRFQWSNGIKGVATYETREQADDEARKIQVYAAAFREDMTVTTTVERRGV